MINVAHFNNGLTGGAAIAARRLHDALFDLRSHQVNSHFYFNSASEFTLNAPFQGRLEHAGYHAIDEGRKKSQLGRISQKIRLLGANEIFRRTVKPESEFSFARLNVSTPPPIGTTEMDIIHLHWISLMLDYSSFFASLPSSKPLVWTLHDACPLTGGCHYMSLCRGFESTCGNCPQLNAPGSHDVSARGLETKIKSLKGRTLHVVANSLWLEEQARKSPVFADATSFQTIHYGLDSEAFSPKDKAVCRQVLGIKEDRFVVAFGAESLSNSRKGLLPLLKALSQMQTISRTTALIFGDGFLPSIELKLPEIRAVGFLSSPVLQSLVYSAADVFVIPSLEEAFGQTGIEAMACGTPVIGFNTGGIPDFLRENETGKLVPVGDTNSLSNALDWMAIHAEERARMGHNARLCIEREFTRERQADDYVELYRRIIS